MIFLQKRSQINLVEISNESTRSIDNIESLLLLFLKDGGVAQLARAREWHSRGRGFDSLHLQ